MLRPYFICFRIRDRCKVCKFRSGEGLKYLQRLLERWDYEISTDECDSVIVVAGYDKTECILIIPELL